ncbi:MULTISPECIES: SapC family protein [unclassified Halomonas]|uniref:SapC family protein n=1 Tax=unclassified Halomonas TaxID=2609666 RepID=UPI00209CC3E8|nr:MULTISPECIES: SapC family protein [unclassified Halomonas]MCP1314293.1 SapC family protein [Halomonas sp. 707D7]MCP1326338.1 SapC family protein [Halomonas sp. 707D4]
MADPLVLNPRECEGKTWHPPHDLAFAASSVLIPLHGRELAKAAASMPLALVEVAGVWQLVGVCGLALGHNLFVREGKWLGSYQPEWLSTWPFEIATRGERGYVTFERESGLEDVHGAGEPFFDDQGQMSPAVASRVEALKASFPRHQATRKAVAALVEAGVVTPWPEALKQSQGVALDGLYMVDEPALAKLDDAAFLELRRLQALPIAYALNLSITQTHLLGRLARLNPGQVATPDNLDSVFGNDDDEFSFDFDS